MVKSSLILLQYWIRGSIRGIILIPTAMTMRSLFIIPFKQVPNNNPCIFSKKPKRERKPLKMEIAYIFMAYATNNPYANLSNPYHEPTTCSRDTAYSGPLWVLHISNECASSVYARMQYAVRTHVRHLLVIRSRVNSYIFELLLLLAHAAYSCRKKLKL